MQLKEKILTYFIRDFYPIVRCVIKNGFTLAETLIVIGIIGTIAAFTIPALISNVQNKILADEFNRICNTGCGYKKGYG